MESIKVFFGFLLRLLGVLALSVFIFLGVVKSYNYVDDWVLNCAEKSILSVIGECTEIEQSELDPNAEEINNLDKVVAVSDIRRNYFLLFFAIFAGGLAVWARWAHQKQLKHTEKQIENSLAINRNDRYVKSVEMLEKDKSEVSYRGGLYILGELMTESNDYERTLYGETIADWLRSADVSVELRSMAMKLLAE